MGDNEWPILDSGVEYQTEAFTCGYDVVEQPDGTRRRCDWVELPPAVVIIATVEDDLLFVDQYRPAVRERHLELPAGFVEPHTNGDAHARGTVPGDGGESYESAAARELREETGFDPDETTLLQRLRLETSVMRHERGFVHAEGLTPGETALEPDEFLDVERVPVDEAVAVARAQPANDVTIEGLLVAKDAGIL